MVQNQWLNFGIGAPPILEPILVGIGTFTGGMVFFLIYSHVCLCSCLSTPRPAFMQAACCQRTPHETCRARKRGNRLLLGLLFN